MKRSFNDFFAQKRNFFLLLAAALIMFVCAGALTWSSQAYVMSKAEENITNLLLSHKGLHHYVQKVLIPAYTRYQDENDISPDFYAPELLSSSFILRKEHVFYNQERLEAGLPELYYKLAAINPRNPVNQADAWEAKLIRRFNHDPELKSFKEIVEIDGRRMLYVAIPFLRNAPQCLHCHGERDQAPPGLQARYCGDGGFNEHEGGIRAITSIRAPLENEFSHIYTMAISIFVGSLFFIVLLMFNARLGSEVREKTFSLKEKIIEEQQAREELARKSSMLAEILNTIPQAIFWKGLDGNYLGCNQVFAKSAGLSEPEMIVGKNDFDLPWPQAESEAYRADDRQVMISGQPKRNIVEPLLMDNGKRIWIETTKVPLFDGRDKVYGVLGVFDDITDRHKLEEQLRQSQRLEAMGTLAGGIAHDFNNILVPILGYAEMVLSELPPESETARNQSAVIKAAYRARDLVAQILAFARQGEHEQRPLQLQPVIKEVLKLLRATIPSTIEIHQDLASATGVVSADPTQIHQVIMNLCTNAYHAMEETGGVLRVALNSFEVDNRTEITRGFNLSPGRYLHLEISDTGCGMDKELCQRIFEPYFTTKVKGKGTGLGLAMVHGIVKSLNGHISVYSEPGQGSCFHVYLPEEVKENNDSPIAVLKDGLPHGQERIMVVDDEPEIVTLTKKMLERLGYRVTVCDSSEEAWKRLQSEPDAFDLLLTDMTMPKLTGIELAQRYISIKPDAAVVICTGFSGIVNEEKAKTLGVKEFLMKPVLLQDLAQGVRRALDEKEVS